ncbi:universal stress protein [Flavobacterium sp. LM5]|uniref:universal stress protein n=1 Tax=Flavobacterium sp. LM5 TaxID=1938610 RepID=UPI001CB9CCCB|nr:universal stress protein [Flavobacterium sp. LM5]
MIIVSLNAKLVFDEIQGWLSESQNSMVLWFTVVPLAIGFLVLLLYIVVRPFLSQSKVHIQNHSPHNLQLQFNATQAQHPEKIAIAVDFSFADETALNYAFNLGGKEAEYTLIHVVETVGAMMYGKQTDDHETTIDEKLLLDIKPCFKKKVSMSKPYLVLGAQQSTSKLVNKGKFDLLIMGTHGHTGFKDLLLGTTIDHLRHKISIPLVLINNPKK